MPGRTWFAWMLAVALAWAGCSGTDEVVRDDKPVEANTGPVKPPPPAVGPRFDVSYSVMAEVLHMTEGVSIWRRDLGRSVYRAFDDRFGLDDADRGLLKKFAFIRNELLERDIKRQVKPTFAKPFGPEGLFPATEPGFEARFWQGVMSVSEPAAVRRALGGVVQPADAEAVSDAMVGLASRVGELISEFSGYGEQAIALQTSLSSGSLPQLLDSLGRFCGIDSRQMQLKVYLVWAPEGAEPQVAEYGDSIVVELPQGASIGPLQVAQVVAVTMRRMLARVDERTKALVTGRFVEAVGSSERPFLLTQALADAAGFGLAAPLAAAGPAEVPSWPGEAGRQRLAEAMTGFMREQLAKGKRLDGVFALLAAKVVAKVRPPRPADFVDGAMVIAHDGVLKPFKEKVTRWMVWKYPITGKYNFAAKLDYSPGRSVLMVLTPKDLQEVQGRFPTKPKIVAMLKKATQTLKKTKGVIVSMPRESRGFIFVMASAGPEAMQRVAKTFFELDSVPDGIVPVE